MSDTPRTLTELELSAIREAVGHYPSPRAAGVEALKVVQQTRGWVPDDALEDVAAELGLAAADLENLATFYNLIFRRPVGGHVILVCDSVSCWVMGYEDLHAALRERLGIDLGETTPDGRFTLLPVPCLGACDGAPALMIDDDLHLDVTPERLDELLARYPLPAEAS